MKQRISETLAALPPVWPEPLLPRIQDACRVTPETIVVVDDDPTGTQTVHDTPILTEWSTTRLENELSAGPGLFYILTNSRSVAVDAACRIAREVGTNLRAAAEATKRRLVLVSRSDSTLRGHYPAEVTALAEAAGQADSVHVIIPFFEDGGRWTIDDVHYVVEGEWLTPAAETPFARDASFGFSKSDLKEWVEEKTGGAVSAGSVRSIGLATLRSDGPDEVARQLLACSPGDVCVVNAVTARDMEVFVLGAMQAAKGGAPLLFRTAASFVQVRAGLETRPLLSREEVCGDAAGGGLIVVGSYVPKSTRQLECLLDRCGSGRLARLEMRVDALLETSRRDREIGRCTEHANRGVASGRDVIVYTSRDLVTGPTSLESLQIGQQVSAAVADVVRGLATRPRFVVAKGGITSSDVATEGLGVKRALVLGQLISGVPVWRLGDESRFPGLGYVVFPGNVGDDEGLFQVYQKCVGS